MPRHSYAGKSVAVSISYASAAIFCVIVTGTPDMDVDAFNLELSPEDNESPLEFLIGRDAGGHWLAVETHGLAGGFFASAHDALRFVNSGVHPRASRIEIVEDVLEPFGASCLEIATRYRKRPTA